MNFTIVDPDTVVVSGRTYTREMKDTRINPRYETDEEFVARIQEIEWHRSEACARLKELLEQGQMHPWSQ